MKVSGSLAALLKQKGSEVYGIAPDETVFDALKIMGEKNVGALLVIEGQRLVGVISERDYTRKVALMGRSSAQTKVRQILSTPAVRVSPNESVEECMRLMSEHKVRHLPVLEGDQIVGVVSMGDLVNWTISAQNAALDQLEDYITGAKG